MSKKRVLNWDEVWDTFDEWSYQFAQKRKAGGCKHCGSVPRNIDPDWQEQQRAIERIAEKMLREKANK